MLRRTYRTVMLGLGFLMVALGVVGAFLPVMPTVPFLLLAAFFFSRSSPRWHAWLLQQPRVGPILRDWDAGGVIRPKYKVLATLMILAIGAWPMILPNIPVWGKALAALGGAAGLLLIWTRPGAPTQRPTEDIRPRNRKSSTA